MMEGMDPSMEDPYSTQAAAPPPPPVAGATVTPGATTGHGFIITLIGTTPNSNPAGLLSDTVIKSLEDYVAKAEIVTTTPLRSNQARIAEMVRVFTAAEQARGLPLQQQQQFAPVIPGMAPEMEQDPAAMQAQPGQPLLGPTGQPLEDPRPFKDRLMVNEDVRDDSEFTIVFAVVLDPTPPAPAAPTDGTTPSAPADGTTPSAPTAAAQ